MSNVCIACGRTESEAMADAKALGLVLEFEVKTYNCCQIKEWADEQALAWFEAKEADGKFIEGTPELAQLHDRQLVPTQVRSRRLQVSWYRNPNDRG